MRKNIFALLGIAVILFGVDACKKSDINGDKNILVPGSILTLTKNINGNLDVNKPTATVSIQVGSKGTAVESVNIYFATDGGTDPTKWKLIKNVPYTDGVTLSVSTAELNAALAPAVAAPGNLYVLQNEAVTKDGHKFSAANTPTNYTSFTSAYNIFFSWSATAVCAFVAPMAGNYKVIQDDWQEWAKGDTVKVTDGPKVNQLNLGQVWPNKANGAVVDSLYINVDPVTGAATSPTGLIWADYGAYKASNLDGSSGFVFSCTGIINITIHLNASGFGDQGKFKLILQKL